MGKKALAVRRTERAIRRLPLSDMERQRLRAVAGYEGSPFHKRNPGDFGLTPPSLPRHDATLCDEAQVFQRAVACALLEKAIERELVSEATAPGSGGLPKHLWAIDDHGQVFEAMYGGSQVGRYHGYPIRRSDPFFERITALWKSR